MLLASFGFLVTFIYDLIDNFCSKCFMLCYVDHYKQITKDGNK